MEKENVVQAEVEECEETGCVDWTSLTAELKSIIGCLEDMSHNLEKIEEALNELDRKIPEMASSIADACCKELGPMLN